MNVYKKLQNARTRLQRTALSKSGHNKFAGYQYFELGDFLPAIQEICNEVGLCGVINFTQDMASLTIFDTEAEGSVVFSSPMSTAALKGCHDVQNLGAVQTYLRRYLWTNAFEIVEHDALDAGVKDDKPEPKPQRIVGEGEWRISAPPKPEGDSSEWKQLVEQASMLALGLAKSEKDVMSVYKNNRTLFDTLKEVDEDFFKGLMDKFTTAKIKFKESK
jgi:hypothetical protein